MNDNQDKSLVEELDETARALLAKIRQDDKVSEKELFIEQVKAFDSVAKWAQARQALIPAEPAEKKETKFERAKRSFHGETSGRRRSPRQRKASDGDVSDTAEPGSGRSTDADSDDAADEGDAAG
jgi:hypothetical protein